jgi:hypothetical protein
MEEKRKKEYGRPKIALPAVVMMGSLKTVDADRAKRS